MTQTDMTIISLQKLIGLKTEILCGGHFGVYQPANEVKDYIEDYLCQLSTRHM